MAALPTAPGVSVYDLACQLDVSERSLKDRLRNLWQCGIINRQDSRTITCRWVYWKPALI